ncbi:MAG: DUF6261 family protein [Bacteroidota bacterium]|nr:DUF6261 family protein [Bacteroidota bacterium]
MIINDVSESDVAEVITSHSKYQNVIKALTDLNTAIQRNPVNGSTMAECKEMRDEDFIAIGNYVEGSTNAPIADIKAAAIQINKWLKPLCLYFQRQKIGDQASRINEAITKLRLPENADAVQKLSLKDATDKLELLTKAADKNYRDTKTTKMENKEAGSATYYREPFIQSLSSLLKWVDSKGQADEDPVWIALYKVLYNRYEVSCTSSHPKDSDDDEGDKSTTNGSGSSDGK